MKCVTSSIFIVIQFTYQGKIVNIDQHDYYTTQTSNDKNIPLVGDS